MPRTQRSLVVCRYGEVHAAVPRRKLPVPTRIDGKCCQVQGTLTSRNDVQNTMLVPPGPASTLSKARFKPLMVGIPLYGNSAPFP